MDESHKASFRGYLKARLFDLITPACKEINYLGGFGSGALTKDQAEKVCTEYGKKLLEGPDRE